MKSIEIPGRPVPKARPRVVRGHTYTPSRSKEFEENIAWYVRAEGVHLGDAPVHCKIELWSIRKLTGDLDNYAKAVLDGLQKGQAFDNDRQVVGLEVLSVIGLEDKTVVQLIPLSRD